MTDEKVAGYIKGSRSSTFSFEIPCISGESRIGGLFSLQSDLKSFERDDIRAWMYVPSHLHAGTREMNISFLTRDPPQTYIFHLAITISERWLAFSFPLQRILWLTFLLDTVVNLDTTCRLLHYFWKFVSDLEEERTSGSTRSRLAFLFY